MQIYNDVFRSKEHYEYVSAEEIYLLLDSLKENGGCYIYGAGRYAKAVIKCLCSLRNDVSIRGIIVTNEKQNPKSLMEIDVHSIKDCDYDKNLPVLIAVQEHWQEKIFNLLRESGYTKVLPISQLHINQLGELYYKKQLRELGLDTDVLDLMNVKRFYKDFWKSRFNNMCDLCENLKIAIYKKAAETSAEFIIENMLNAKCYDNRGSMHYEVCNRAGDGLYLEFGVAAGGSINAFAEWRKDKTIYGFDSFEGLPEDWLVASTDAEKGILKQNAIPKVRDNVELVIGLFDETLPNFLIEHTEPVAFAHIDCDLYSSAKYVLDLLMKEGRLVSGTEIIFDEYLNFPGWEKQGEHTAFMETINKYGIKFEYTGFSAEACQVSVRII